MSSTEVAPVDSDTVMTDAEIRDWVRQTREWLEAQEAGRVGPVMAWTAEWLAHAQTIEGDQRLAWLEGLYLRGLTQGRREGFRAGIDAATATVAGMAR